jgi:hypothetical protein
VTIAHQNKGVVYNLLMKAAAETTLAIASDPKRLGARIGVTAVLHTWGSALTISHWSSTGCVTLTQRRRTSVKVNLRLPRSRLPQPSTPASASLEAA